MRLALGLVALAALAAPWFNVPHDQADSAGMLAHLHGFFVAGDLLYDDEYAALGMSPTFAFVTGEGVVSNHWPAGATWLQAPGYLLGLVAARVLASLGIGTFDPYGVIPLLGVRTWAMLVMIGGAAAVGRWFASHTDARTGVVAAVLFVVGTPLLYYAAESPLRPHLWGSIVVLGLVRAWARDPGNDRISRAAVLGAGAGLATAIRPQLAPLVLLGLHDAWESRDGRIRRLAVVCGAFAPWPLVHLRMQAWLYGRELGDYASPVSHHLQHFLFSPYHGMFVWTPVLALGCAAMLRAAVLRERGALLLSALAVHQVWLDSGMRDIEPYAVLGTRTWAGGVSFGARKLVDVLPLFLPALLSATRAVGRRNAAIPWAALVVLLAAPTVGLHAAAFVDPHRTTGVVHDWESLRQLLVLPLDPDAWRAALDQRALPVPVPVILATIVAIPLTLAGRQLWRLHRSSALSTRLRVGIGVLLCGAVLAHLHLSILVARSETILREQPERMVEARLRMHPAHEAMVRRIADHHALLRARLGDDAAP